MLCEAYCYCILEGMDAYKPLWLQELQLKCWSPAGHLRGREKLRQGYWTKPAGHGWGHNAPNVISLIQLHGHTTSETHLILRSVCLACVRAFTSMCLFNNWNTIHFFLINLCIKPCFQVLRTALEACCDDQDWPMMVCLIAIHIFIHSFSTLC